MAGTVSRHVDLLTVHSHVLILQFARCLPCFLCFNYSCFSNAVRTIAQAPAGLTVVISLGIWTITYIDRG
jgi:hypothetical protein